MKLFLIIQVQNNKSFIFFLDIDNGDAGGDDNGDDNDQNDDELSLGSDDSNAGSDDVSDDSYSPDIDIDLMGDFLVDDLEGSDSDVSYLEY